MVPTSLAFIYGMKLMNEPDKNGHYDFSLSTISSLWRFENLILPPTLPTHAQ